MSTSLFQTKVKFVFTTTSPRLQGRLVVTDCNICTNVLRILKLNWILFFYYFCAFMKGVSLPTRSGYLSTKVQIFIKRWLDFQTKKKNSDRSPISFICSRKWIARRDLSCHFSPSLTLTRLAPYCILQMSHFYFWYFCKS